MLVNKCLNKDSVIIMHRKLLPQKVRSSSRESARQLEKQEVMLPKLVGIKDHGLTIVAWRISRHRM
jgi:hypothetical protein